MQNIQDLSTLVSLEESRFPSDLQVVDAGKSLFKTIQDVNNYGLIFNTFIYFTEQQSRSFQAVEGGAKNREGAVVKDGACTIYTQQHLWDLLIHKVLQLSILISADRPGSVINVFYDCDESQVRVIIRCPFFLPTSDVSWILSDDYKQFIQSLSPGFAIKRGSGLEGVILKNVSSQLGVKLSCALVQESMLEILIVHPH